MDEEIRIHILKKPDVTDLSGEKVMIDFDSGQYFLLTGSANEIWDMMADGATVSEIVDGLCEIYDVMREECLGSTLRFLGKLEEIGFISLEGNA